MIMTKNNTLVADIKIYELNPRQKDARGGVHLKMKSASIDSVKEILKKYFG